MNSLRYAASESLDALTARYPFAVATVVAVLLAMALATVGPLDHSSRALDDLLIRHAPVSLPEAGVLLVEMPPELLTALTDVDHSENPAAVLDLASAIQRLRKLGARQMAIGLMPEAASILIADALAHDDVLFGRRSSPGRGPTNDLRLDGLLEPLPDAYRPLSDRFGVLAAPILEDGVSRESALFTQVGNQVLPTLESRLASRAGGKPIPIGQGPLRIDFRGDGHRLPTVEFERLISGDLLATLVEGRAILLGAGPSPYGRGIATPRSRSGDLLSVLEYRGYVVDTLLRDGGLSRSRWVSVALILCAALLGATMGQLLSFRVAILASMATGLGYVFAAWLSLGLFGFHLPALALSMVQPLACSCVLVSRHAIERGELRRAMRRTSALVRTLPEVPMRSSESGAAWTRVAQLLKTSVGVERLLLLEIDDVRENAREVHSEGCEMDPDRRHDLTESPYAEMIRTNVARELTDNIFEAASPRSAQFLMPLSAGGRWLGFCIAEALEHGPEYEATLLRSLREIAPLAGRLLAEWKRTAVGEVLSTRIPGHGWSSRGTGGEARRLEAIAESLYRRIETLQKVVEDGNLASAAFDLTGSLVHSNSRMHAIATEYDLAFADSNPALVLSQLTGFDLERTRSMIRYALTDLRKHVVPVRPLRGLDARTLHVSPLERPTVEIEDPSRPFPPQGILVEIIDDEVAHQHHRHRARVAPIAERADLDLSRLAESIDKLSREGEADTSEITLLARSARSAVVALREDLAHPPQPGASGSALFEASTPLEHAAQQHGAECNRRGISIVFDRPERPIFVKAPESPFQDLLEASVSLLVRDAMDSSTLTLQVFERPDRIEYGLRNQGYGMPSNVLRKGLSEIDDGSLADLTRIRQALPAAESVGADFAINSEVGEGICIDLIMPRAL